jgi:phosphoglycolate phosphatase-like HAD superfamily hydrolase
VSRSTLVLFDIDGTLMRGAGAHHKEALLEGVRRVTGRVTSFDGIDTAGKLDMDLIVALLGGPAESQILQQIAHETQAAYLTNCNHDLRPFVLRGARELIEQLHHRGAALALVTGNLSAIGWRKMELAGLKDFFHTGAFSEDASTRSEIAKLAALRARREQHALPDCRIALIGDHSNDIEAAKTNGFLSIAVASGPMPGPELLSHSPDILLESLADLDLSTLFMDQP